MPFQKYEWMTGCLHLSAFFLKQRSEPNNFMHTDWYLGEINGTDVENGAIQGKSISEWISLDYI